MNHNHASLRPFLAFVLFVSFVLSGTDTRAQGKKVYISVDLEGISGVNGDDQTGPVSQDQIDEALRASYLCGRPDGPRSFVSVAWAVRGAVPETPRSRS